MGRHIVITGGNRGIGLELCKQFIAKGDTVTALCRNSSPELDALGATVFTSVDVTDRTSVQLAKQKCNGKPVDILINNAGILSNESLDKLDDGAEARILLQFRINSLAPLVVTSEFSDTLKIGSKVILMTSRMGSITDNEHGGQYGYRMSKAALNAAGKSLAIDFEERGIYVGILHPGWVQTDMTGYTGSLTPAQSVAGLIQQIEALDETRSGRFFHSNGNELPW